MLQAMGKEDKPRREVWQCLKCGYVCVSSDPPEECPECGAPRESFLLLEED
jgi:rubrerythrin